MIRPLTYLATAHPKAVLAVLTALTLAAVALIAVMGLRQDFSPHLLPPEHPSRQAYQRLRAEFTGTGEAMLVHLRHEHSVFNAATLERVLALTSAFESFTLLPAPALERAIHDAMPELEPDLRNQVENLLAGGLTGEDLDAVLALQVEPALEDGPAADLLTPLLDELLIRLQPVRKVSSLANSQNILAERDELSVHEVYEAPPESPEAIRRIRGEVTDNELFRDIFLSQDERSTGIVVETWIPPESTDLMFELYGAMQAAIERIPGDEETGIAGVPAAVSLGRNYMEQDSAVLFPVVIALVVGTLYLTFRSLAGIVLPLAVVLISIGWTLGLMVLFGIPLNLITNAMPVFLITIGVADGVHMISEFQDAWRNGHTRREAVASMLRHMTLPVIMTSLTTAVGFLSLAYTEIRYVRLFGWFVAFGVMVAMVISLLFIPAVLSLGRQSPRAPSVRRSAPAWGLEQRLSSGLAALSAFAIRRRHGVLLAFLALGVWAAFGVSRIEVDSNVIAYFKEDVPIVRASQSLDEHMAGSTSVYLLIDCSDEMREPFKDPRVLAGVEGLQRHLELYFPYIGRSFSLADAVRRMNFVMHGNDPDYDRLPRRTEWVREGAPGDAERWTTVSGRDLISQYLLLYESGGGESLSDLTDSEYRSLRVGLTLTTSSSPAIQRMTEEAQRYARAHLPPDTKVRFAGWGELNVSMTEEIVGGQINSLGLSLAAVFLMLLLQFRALGKSLFAFTPLLFTILLNFGAMGWFGIPLDIGTSLVSAVALGIGVDYAIHYLERLRTELRQGVHPTEAFARTMRTSGKAISANALVVAVGFLALTFSQFNPIGQIGWLVSQTLVVSAAATVILLPALAAFIRPAFIVPAGEDPFGMTPAHRTTPAGGTAAEPGEPREGAVPSPAEAPGR